VSAHVDRLARALEQAGDGSVRAIVLYGSHLLAGARPDRHSAVDFLVLVDEYRPFYAALEAAGELPRPPWLMTWLSHLLPPNVIAFTPEDGRAGIAKCLVVRTDHFTEALGPRPPDHFILGRMLQRVALVRARDEASRAVVERALARAHRHVLDWMAPYLEGGFDARTLGRRLLEVCYRGELRPEAKNRAVTLYEAQAEHFERTLGPTLEARRSAGGLESADEGYRLARPVARRTRVYWKRHFRRSKRRATLRWLKHTVTFANWLPYVVRKVERHTGRPVRLTPLEQRLPLIFLWPRVLYVLLTRPSRRGD